MAEVRFGDGDALGVPVAVARALESSVEESGEPSSRAELLWRIRESADACAWARVVDMASRREYSTKEACDRLRRDGYASACVERVVARAVESRVIDDARFADAFVRGRLAQGWGPVRVERELALRGVEASEVPGWPDGYFAADGGGSVMERARTVLARRPVPERNAYPKLLRFLVSRGFPSAVARDVVVERLDAEREASEGEG